MFAVADGARSGKCPACGKVVETGPAENWLQDVDLDGLSLEQGPGPEVPAQEGAEAPRAPRPVGTPAADAAGATRGGAVERAAAAAARRQTAPAVKAPKHGPPQSVLDLFKVLRDDPTEAAPLLRDGVTGTRFMVEMGVGFAVLSLIGGGLVSWLLHGGAFNLAGTVSSWLRLVIEAAAAGIMLSLLAIGLKRQCRPLGVVQGAVFARMISVAVLLPVGVGLAILTAILTRGEAYPGALMSLNGWMPKVYVVTVMLAQGAVTAGVFGLGCGGGLAISAVVVYGGAMLARQLVGMVGL